MVGESTPPLPATAGSNAEQELWALLDAVLVASPAAMALVDRHLRVIRQNPRMQAFTAQRAVTGARLDEVAGTRLLPIVDHVRSVLETGLAVRDQRISAPDEGGIVMHHDVSSYPIRSASGLVTAVALVVSDATERQHLRDDRDSAVARAESSRLALAGLQASTVAVAEATSIAGVVDVVLGVGLRAMRADAGLVAFVGDDGAVARVAGSAGYRPGSSLPVEVPREGVLARTMLTGEPAFCRSANGLVECDPTVGELFGPLPHASLAALPLRAGSHVLGALAVSFLETQPFDDEQVATLTAMADLSAAALWRVRLLGEEERALAAAAAAAERNAFLAEATAVVSAPLDEGRVLERLARLCVPRLGDWCSITRPCGDDLQRVLVYHRDPALAELTRSMLHTTVPLDSEIPTAVTFRTGAPQLLSEIDRTPAGDPALLDVLRRLGSEYGITVPIGPPSRPLGVLAFAVGPGRLLTEDDLELAAEIALRAGIAVDHAETFARERDVAALLQRAILPSALPAVPGVSVAATYRPAGRGRTVGGDWFDAFTLPDGRLAVAVGDVAGHGIGAAAAMAQLRNALRAYLVEGHGPGQALHLLNRLLAAERQYQHATVVAAVFDVSARAAVVATAGHPPPLLATGPGAAHLVEVPIGPMLGAIGEAMYPEHQIGVPAGATLVLFTDGLVERRDQSLDTSMSQLCAMVAEDPPTADDLARWCDRLAGWQLEDRGQDDDRCVLVLTTAAPASDAAAPAGGGLARLRRWDLDPELGTAQLVRQGLAEVLSGYPKLAELQLCVTEVVVNAVLHAGTPFSVTVDADAREVCVGVRDASSSMPTPKHLGPTAPTGRGLRLLDALADEWGVTADADGKVVWFSFSG